MPLLIIHMMTFQIGLMLNMQQFFLMPIHGRMGMAEIGILSLQITDMMIKNLCFLIMA